MTPGQARRQARKNALRLEEAMEKLQSLAKSIERCEKSIVELQEAMTEVNQKHQNRQTTRDDVNYLEDVLRCARKKLAWEEQMESISKRIPEALAAISDVMNDPNLNPPQETRELALQLLQNVQASMVRLEQAKAS